MWLKDNVSKAIERCSDAATRGTTMQTAYSQNTSPNQTVGKREWCDDPPVHLRRKAAFCLRVADLCSDELIANHLRSQAAEYHQRALWAEFHLRDDADRDDACRQVACLHTRAVELSLACR